MGLTQGLARLTGKRWLPSAHYVGTSARSAVTSFPTSSIPHVNGEVPYVTEKAFASCLRSSDTYTGGSEGRKVYIDSSIPRLHRIIVNMMQSELAFQGPSLDVASGWGILYPCFRQFFPTMLPYSIAEMQGSDLVIDGDLISCKIFECDKDLLPLDDSSLGTVTFFDCLEHLIVDPVWTILELNRVLKLGGRLVLSTPNAAACYRVFKILGGENPGSEIVIKPASIYQRHNREWTLDEVGKLVRGCGFEPLCYSTNAWTMARREGRFLDQLRGLGYAVVPNEQCGPDLFLVAEKVAEKTLSSDLSSEERWPEWLYSPHAAYHRRPRVFPIVVGEDYA